MKRRVMGGNKLNLSLSLGGGGFVAFQGESFTKQTAGDFISGLSDTGCTLEDLGVSSDGVNHLWGMSYGDVGKPVIMITTGQHGDEWWGNYAVKQFMSNLVNPKQGSGLVVAELLSHFRFYAIPLINPYGYTNGSYGNASGVDINSNFDNNWAAYDDSALAPITKGASAESEVETQIVANKIGQLAPVAIIDVHNGFPAYDYVIIYNGNSNEQIVLNTKTELDDLFSNGSTILYTTESPMLYMYGRHILSHQNRYPISCLVEIAEEDTTENSRITLNILLKYCQQILEYKESNYPVIIQPTEALSNDTQIWEYAPTYNYGIGSALNVGSYEPGRILRSLIKFPTAYLMMPYAGISSALLRLYCAEEQSTTNEDVSIYKALTEWFEGAKSGAAPDGGQDGSTWNLRNANGAVAWGAVGGQSGVDYTAVATDTVTITAPLAYYDFDVTADWEAFTFGGANYGWWLICDDEVNASTRKLFHSASHTNRPKLTVTFPARVMMDHEWQFNGTLNDNPGTGKTAINLTHADAAVYTVDGYGRKNNALVMDGATDYVQNADPISDVYDLGNKFTIIAEFTPTNLGSDYYYICSLGNGATVGYALYISLIDSKLRWHNGSTSGKIGEVVLVDDTFYRLVLVQDGTNTTAYLNGTQVYTSAVQFSGPASQSVYDFLIGAQDSGNYKFKGTISRVAIIKGTALTEDQVQAE